MTKEEIIEMARQAGFVRLGHDDCDLVCYPEELEAFAKMVAEKEREACVELCLQHSMIQLDERVMRGIDHCIEAIRARGQE